MLIVTLLTGIGLTILGLGISFIFYSFYIMMLDMLDIKWNDKLVIVFSIIYWIMTIVLIIKLFI
jgi:hypothetical protein